MRSTPQGAHKINNFFPSYTIFFQNKITSQVRKRFLKKFLVLFLNQVFKKLKNKKAYKKIPFSTIYQF